MTKIAQSLFMILTISESILGICCNGFIWSVNCISLVKSKKMSLSESVITSLAISRICLLCILIADVLTYNTNLNETSIVMHIISMLWTFVNFLSISLAACLSIFYCLKIANFSYHAFFWLKWRVSHVVRWILLASVLFSFFSTPILIKEFGDTFSYRQMTPKANCTEDNRETKSAYFFKYIFTVLWMVMPFFLSLISYILIILSLRRHTKQMQNNGTGSRDPSTEAHVRATKIILSFLFLFIAYLVAFFIILLGFLLPDAYLAWMIGETILAAHPFVHSILLIVGNNKLKQAFLGMFQIKK
ncbi:taste receptor type 2 member 3-like [Trichosurus vulpecula]|uniref:taste receptor type 2 member 3-like n=1 Tax=Trichosurus vulpecula TaxID=9337 RepID=UPI00186AE8B7|nr:taste receptor type 2 member 3-like [Trichosurus vulpecula]